jgi:hypothetical protein
MQIKANIKNGRLFIESNTKQGSVLLDKWINENKTFFHKFLDIEILAHDEHKQNESSIEEIERLLNELHNDIAKSIIEMNIYKPLNSDLIAIKEKIRLLKDE